MMESRTSVAAFSDMNSRYNNKMDSLASSWRGGSDEDDEYGLLAGPTSPREEVVGQLRDAVSLFPDTLSQFQRSVNHTLVILPPPGQGEATAPPPPPQQQRSMLDAVKTVPLSLVEAFPPDVVAAEEAAAKTRQSALPGGLPQKVRPFSAMPRPGTAAAREGDTEAASQQGSDVFFTIFLRRARAFEVSTAYPSSPRAEGSGAVLGRGDVTDARRQPQTATTTTAVEPTTVWCSCGEGGRCRWRAEAREHSATSPMSVASFIGFNHSCGFALLLERVYCQHCGFPIITSAPAGWVPLDGPAAIRSLVEDDARTFLARTSTFESLTALLLHYYAFDAE